MLNIFKTPKKNDLVSPAATYRSACVAACETVEGARALADEIFTKSEGVAHDATGLKVALRRQFETATHAAKYRAMEHEIFHRIPAACRRDEEAAMAAIKAAERSMHAAEKQVSAAKARVEAFGASAQQKRNACDVASEAASSNLRQAEAELQAARDREDALAMSKAAEVVVKARKEVLAVYDRNSASLLEANSLSELADKAQEELRTASSLFKDAEQKRHEAHLALLAVQADRKSLDYLLAHVRWWKGMELVEGSAIPSHIDNAGFFFHQSERAPQWQGKPGSVAIGQQQLGQYRGLRWALSEPDWSVFEVDPSRIQSDGPVETVA
jgi:hypothetical protein